MPHNEMVGKGGGGAYSATPVRLCRYIHWHLSVCVFFLCVLVKTLTSLWVEGFRSNLAPLLS